MEILDEGLPALTLFAAIGCGLVAGLFCSFSNFVMRALAKLPPEQGMAAMRAINQTILNPLFLFVFVGTAVACLILLVVALLHRDRASSLWLIAGSVLYLLGSILVTRLFNIPRNDALEAADPDSPDSIPLWRDYLVGWTRWNHVRSVTTLLATVALMLGRNLSP